MPTRMNHSPVGIVLCFASNKHPLYETYKILIPALLMGNIAIVKLPCQGGNISDVLRRYAWLLTIYHTSLGLVHMLTLDLYAAVFPNNLVQFISGESNELVDTIMQSGDINMLAFSGCTCQADRIIKNHPHPHRLKLYLQLERKNIAIVLANADLENTVQEIAEGALYLNGQHRESIKIVLVHSSIVLDFLHCLNAYVNKLKCGFPWLDDVDITPLKKPSHIQFLQEILIDALRKGATIVNSKEGGGKLNYYSTLMRPAIVYPVTESMRLWSEDQMGPIIPIVSYHDMNEVFDFVSSNMHGIQASIFTSLVSLEATGPLVDALSHSVSQININTHGHSGHRSGHCLSLSDNHATHTDVSKGGANNHLHNTPSMKGESKQLNRMESKPTATELVLVDELIDAFSTTTLIRVGLNMKSMELQSRDARVLLKELDSYRETCGKE